MAIWDRITRLAFLVISSMTVLLFAEDRTGKTVNSRLFIQNGTPKNPAGRPMDVATPTPWTNGTILYSFADNFVDGYEKDYILSMFEKLQNKTCLRFRRRQNERNYTMFSKGPTCASMVGMHGEKQTVFVARACLNSPRICRQMMHLLGFHSELNRPDRDQTIEINWRNIRPGFRRGLILYPQSAYLISDMAFDHASASLFDAMKFAVDPTIWTVRAKSDHVMKLGNDFGFSVLDIRKINQVYCSSGR